MAESNIREKANRMIEGMQGALDKLKKKEPAPADLGTGLARQAADAIVKRKKDLEDSIKD